MADGLEHRQVGDRVGVCVRSGEIDLPALGDRPDLVGLGLPVAVELELARVLAVHDPRARGDHVRHAEVARERSDDLFRRAAHDVQETPLGPMQRHEVERFLVHERIDDLDDHVAHEVLDLGMLPSPRQREHAVLETVHPFLVCTDERVNELRVRASNELTARDHARAVHRTRQRKRRRARDDRLVEVEESCLHHALGYGSLPTDLGRLHEQAVRRGSPERGASRYATERWNDLSSSANRRAATAFGRWRARPTALGIESRSVARPRGRCCGDTVNDRCCRFPTGITSVRLTNTPERTTATLASNVAPSVRHDTTARATAMGMAANATLPARPYAATERTPNVVPTATAPRTRGTSARIGGRFRPARSPSIGTPSSDPMSATAMRRLPTGRRKLVSCSSCA